MTSTDKTYEWGGAPVVQAGRGVWLRQPDGRYRHSSSARTRTPEELAPLKPRPVELHPATAPEPRTLTWRKDGTGCTWGELVAEFRKGRQAERVLENEGVTATHRGPLWRVAEVWCIGGIHPVNHPHTDCTSATVWLPETPEVPKWAQDCDEWRPDHRLVIADDGRVWLVDRALDGSVTRWRLWGDDATCTTDELAAVGVRLIVDRDGKAVQP